MINNELMKQSAIRSIKSQDYDCFQHEPRRISALKNSFGFPTAVFVPN